jgi:hypothetical protein
MTPHLTDEQLIAHLYGIGADDSHIASCLECQARLSRMQLHRQAVERDAISNDASADFLAAQRRRIYERVSEPGQWWSHPHLRRWASAVAGVAVVAGGMLIFENTRRATAVPNNISDTQLARDVGRMAEDPEPPATAPLQALFEE